MLRCECEEVATVSAVMSRVGRAASASLLLLNFAAAFEQAPFHPPSPPPLCRDGECDAGESCGFCLVLVPALSCPGPKDRIAWTCEFVEPGAGKLRDGGKLPRSVGTIFARGTTCASPAAGLTSAAARATRINAVITSGARGQPETPTSAPRKLS